MRPSSWFGVRFGNSGGCSGWRLQGNGKGGVEIPGKEGAGGTVNETMNGEAEWPAEDSVDSNVIAKSNGKVNGAAIREGVREDIDHDGTE